MLALVWCLAGIICCISIIFIPFGLQCFKFAHLCLVPFGREVCYKEANPAKCPQLIGNILWFLLFGLELALMHFLYVQKKHLKTIFNSIFAFRDKFYF